MSEYKPDPLEVINAIRNSFYNSVETFTTGRCFQFYLILKTIFPEADPWYDTPGHVITEINGTYYDITGKVTPHISAYRMKTDPPLMIDALTWS
jgi:hypothetical protein